MPCKFKVHHCFVSFECRCGYQYIGLVLLTPPVVIGLSGHNRSTCPANVTRARPYPPCLPTQLMF
eukprot:3694219-Amphidinium_carterae.2